MTQIERKLNKLPESFKKKINGIKYLFQLNIKKRDNLWIISYDSEAYDSCYVEVVHEHLQVAVDTMLSEMRKMKIIE